MRKSDIYKSNKYTFIKYTRKLRTFLLNMGSHLFTPNKKYLRAYFSNLKTRPEFLY